MKCAIMQPTYLPWAGFFNLISQVDFFVFLDDAQFQKGSWHNRNKLMISGKPSWITVPVIREFLGQAICDSKIDDTKSWRKQHFNIISQNYTHHEYYDVIKSVLAIIQDESLKCLSTLNIKIIEEICNLLGIKRDFLLSSQMKVEGKRSEKIKNICNHLGCSEYLSPQGAQEYLAEDQFEQTSSIKLTINHFSSVPYKQLKNTTFESYLSIIDVLANIGPDKTREYVLSNITHEVANVS